MESLLSQSQDNLIGGLDFSSSSNTASYVEDRSEQNWFPSGIYFSPNGARIIRASVSGNHIVDIRSFALVGKLHNEAGNHPLKLLTCGIHAMVQRFTCYVNGAQAEDILEYGRTYEMMSRCMSESVRRNFATMSGFTADTSPNSGHDGFLMRLHQVAL